MALHHLGDSFDIVTGGANLIFPHHDNVLAICQAATGKPVARYWLHNEPVLEAKINGEDKDEPATVRHLLDSGVAGEDLRYLLLATHYRKTLHISAEALEGARRSRKRLDLFLERLNRVRQGESWADLPEHLTKLAGDFMAALDDDLNIAGALAVLFNFQREINTRMDQGHLNEAGAQAIMDRLREFDQVLGVMNFPLAATDATIAAKLQEREAARQQQDWAMADRLRQELADQGIEILDTATGPVWRRK
jgi:cysteinyl-tRNA synthetase